MDLHDTSQTATRGNSKSPYMSASTSHTTCLCNLSEGGFGAYVAASRARTRVGLCITEPVTIQQLNKPIPADIRLGLSSGHLKAIPDAEAEHSDKVAIKVKYVWMTTTGRTKEVVQMPMFP